MMRKLVISVVLSLVGWACLVNVGLVVLGRPPLVNVPAKYATVVTAMACIAAFSVAGTSLKLLGRIGLALTALPLFLLGGAAGFMAAGKVGAVVGFVVPLVIALKYGFFGLAAGVAVAVAVYVLR